MLIRHPVVAGMFYEAGPQALRESVMRYLEEADLEPDPDRVAAIIAPHAGYLYSGATAGHAFARVRGKQPGRVLLLGRSHRLPFEGTALPTEDCFETPLGGLPVDQAFLRKLGEDGRADIASAHRDEHCLEVLLPFVQVVLGEIPIVPILFGSDPGEEHVQLGKYLASMLDPGDLVIASTDLSHYLPEERANAMDQATLACVLRRDCREVIRECEQGLSSMCGATAVVCAMACALERGATDWRLLDYRTSARASGDYQRVVGYGALSMEWGG